MPASSIPSYDSRSSEYNWFAYFNGRQRRRRLKPHHVRDGAAFAEIGSLFADRGFRYGRLVLNGPPTPEVYDTQREALDAFSLGGHRRIEEIAAYTPIDESFLRPGDVLVVPTRPPLNDLDHRDKVHSQPGFTSLEQKVFRLCRKYLELCSRAHIRLAPEAAEQLRTGFSNRAAVTFYQTGEPWYRELRRLDGGDPLNLAGRKRPKNGKRQTAAYVLYLREVEILGGSDLLVAFGVGGTQTLVICHRLRRDLDGLLDRPGFKMIEMTADEEEPAPGGLGFAEEWKMEIALEMEPLP